MEIINVNCELYKRNNENEYKKLKVNMKKFKKANKEQGLIRNIDEIMTNFFNSNSLKQCLKKTLSENSQNEMETIKNNEMKIQSA